MSAIIPNAGAAVHLVRAGYDAEGVDGFCRGEGGVRKTFPGRGAARSVAKWCAADPGS
jgi:hypothetical protein